VEKFGIITTTFEAANSVPLLLVFPFITEEGDQMLWKNPSEVFFRYRKRPFILNIIAFQQRPVRIVDSQIQARDLLAPFFESIPQVF